jgi:valyl-tRNA synthetase
VADLRLDPAAVRPRGAASVVVERIQIFVHDVIDEAAERQRLKGELARVEKEITIFSKKLSNDSFVSRAPAEVVEENRQRLAKYELQKASILEALARLDA